MEVKENEDVLLVLEGKKKYLVKVERDKKLHTHKGFIDFNEIIGKRYGEAIKSSLGVEFVICKPILIDYIAKFARRTQIIYPKDAAYIALLANVHSGARIVEIGTGSGALTAVLASIVRPEGHVYSYEINEEYLKITTKNLERLNLLKYVTLKNKNALEGIDEEEVDSIIMDIPNPWEIVKIAKAALKGSGIIFAFCPTMNQVEKFIRTLLEEKFVDIHLVELLEREYQIDPAKIRPKTRMIGHTGYLAWGRKSI